MRGKHRRIAFARKTRIIEHSRLGLWVRGGRESTSVLKILGRFVKDHFESEFPLKNEPEREYRQALRGQSDWVWATKSSRILFAKPEFGRPLFNVETKDADGQFRPNPKLTDELNRRVREVVKVQI